MLRLLNLQNNIIARIDNLLRLPNLIFLDLYNNRIEVIQILASYSVMSKTYPPFLFNMTRNWIICMLSQILEC
jgi:Leucine-rich repeat (LRR) protein